LHLADLRRYGRAIVTVRARRVRAGDVRAIRLVLNALAPASAQAPNCWISYPNWGAVQQ
jgi:hypothetical protein